MSTPPAKRKRTENAPLTRSKTWFSDGNVVLQAADTQFRVHWGVLALHSSIFRDMQGLPQPPDGPDQPSVDGCPVVELFDDPVDVEHLLKALYIPAFHCQKKLPLPVVGALIRLGRKYDLKYLFDSAVARLTAAFPATLEDAEATDDLTAPTSQTFEPYRAMLFDVITLASETNILSVLPLAYYCATQVEGLSGLLKGIKREDGTVASLPAVDLYRCVVGQRRISIKQFEPGYTFGWVRAWESDDCTDPEQCRMSREAVIFMYLDRLDLIALAPRDLDFNLCVACARHTAEYMGAGQKKIWDELPEIFDLPPWNELKNDI
ncbi:hypothetical protein K438DRAFT_1797869 [Mycena galopus ATCC 62051]|nr:hypothetical protein K438DRAFT_1797869 [Mycena galopus ATCC 62051]